MRKLVQIEDVKASGNLPESITDQRLEWLIERVSSLFCAEAGQTFSTQTITKTFHSPAGFIQLTPYPLHRVISVTSSDGKKVDYRLLSGGIALNSENPQSVTVVYEAGLAEVPEVVKLQVVDSICRIANAEHNGLPVGVSQVSQAVGGFSQSMTATTWSNSGQVTLSPDDIRLARRYRPPRIGKSIILQP